MTIVQGILIAFAVLIGALMLPVSSGVRTTLWMLLMGLTVLTALAGGMEYLLGLFQ